MLVIEPGTKNGETRRGPESSTIWWLFSIEVMPPMPEPMAAPDAGREGFLDLETGILHRLHGGAECRRG